MVKRGIGAIVLAIIAALLLGYLLKDKSQARQDLVEMKFPGTTNMKKIPSLFGSDDTITTQDQATLVNETSTKVDNVENSDESITTSASNVFSSFTNSVSEKAKEAKNAFTAEKKTTPVDSSTNKPGFDIRPSNSNEQRETVDTFVNNTTQITNVEPSYDNGPTVTNTVVASTKKVVKAYKPRLVKEKKKPAKKVIKASKPKVVAKASSPIIATSVASAAKGTYSIQLLATSSQSRAEKLANTMRSEGYTAFITQASSNNKIIFRVRVGAHPARNTAITAQESLKRRYQKNFFVQNSLVISNK